MSAGVNAVFSESPILTSRSPSFGRTDAGSSCDVPRRDVSVNPSPSPAFSAWRRSIIGITSSRVTITGKIAVQRMKATIHIRLEREDRVMLEKLKQTTGRTESEIIRRGLQLVADEYGQRRSARRPVQERIEALVDEPKA